MNQEKYYVYVHYRADSLAIFYVGKGKGGRYKATARRNQHWCNVSNKHGFITQILQYFDNETDAFNCEKYLINKFRDAGFELTNLTDGGEGSSGYKLSEETKAKISRAHTGKKRAPRSAEYREKISKLHKGRILSAESRAKISAAHKGKKGTPVTAETKEKISKGNKGKKKPPRSAEHQSNMSKAFLGSRNPKFKGVIVATNIATGEQLILCGQKEIRAANFSHGAVYACVLGKKNHHKGFTFVREEILITEGK